MKAIILYAHPETLRGRGDEVEISNLYAMRFKAVVGLQTGPRKRSETNVRASTWRRSSA